MSAKQITIQERGPTEPVPVQSESAAIISMIERAARDPSVDVDKLRQLMEMRERAEAHTAKREFDAAMTDAQTKLRRVRADASNPQTKSKYASFAAIDRAIRPIYTDVGFSLSFDSGDCPVESHVRVVCDVAHRGGHSRKYHIDMPADGKGAKGGDVMTKTHATGSAVSYGRRYLVGMIFNLAVGDDDDGNAAGDEPISEKQVEELRAFIVDNAVPLGEFLTWCGVKKIEQIPSRDYQRRLDALKARYSAS